MTRAVGPPASGATPGTARFRADGSVEFATLVPEFSEQALLDAFGIRAARAVLLVGSRATRSDEPDSDVDFLAVFEKAGDLPARVPLPGAVSMPHSLGENWIGDLRGQEANVEAVTASTIRRVARLVSRPVGERNAPTLQLLEIRLLDRLRRHVPVRGGEYVRALGVDAALARLPMVTVVMRYCGVASNLPAMRRQLERGDSAGLALLVMIMGGALGRAAMSLHGNLDTSWRKLVPALRALQEEHPELPVTAGDLEAMLSPASDRAALEALTAALGRLRAAVAQRASSDPLWAEALRGFDALDSR